jgi:hypothetical protein
MLNWIIVSLMKNIISFKKVLTGDIEKLPVSADTILFYIWCHRMDQELDVR